MACDTCGHTMQNLGLDTSGRTAFWCERCGTLKVEVRTNSTSHTYDGLREYVRETVVTSCAIPKLVDRCRKYQDDQLNGLEGTVWQALGIAESINVPSEPSHTGE